MPKSTVLSGASNADAEPAEPAAPVGDVNEDGEVAGYETLTKPELQALLEARELPKSGNVPDLIERLEADDAEQAKAAEAEAEEAPAEPAKAEQA